jgi:hypothetical protein
VGSGFKSDLSCRISVGVKIAVGGGACGWGGGTAAAASVLCYCLGMVVVCVGAWYGGLCG